MQNDRSARQGGALRLFGRFYEFMRGSARKYVGGMLAVTVTAAVSFLTPMLVGGTVDAITDAVQGNGRAGQPAGILGRVVRGARRRGVSGGERLGDGGAAACAEPAGRRVSIPARSLVGGGERGHCRTAAPAAVLAPSGDELRLSRQSRDRRPDPALHAGCRDGSPLPRQPAGRDLPDGGHGRAGADSHVAHPRGAEVGFADPRAAAVRAGVLVLPLGAEAVCRGRRGRRQAQRDASGEPDRRARGARLRPAEARERPLCRSRGRRARQVGPAVRRVCPLLVGFHPVEYGAGRADLAVWRLVCAPRRDFDRRCDGVHQLRLDADLADSRAGADPVRLRQGGRLLKRLYEILDAPAEQDTPGASDAPLWADIEFDRVGFAYDGGQPVLRDVSFSVRAGKQPRPSSGRPGAERRR